MKRGRVLIGHGSKSRRGNKTFEDIVAMVKEREGSPVVGAYLQFAEPELLTVVEDLVSNDVEAITVVPLFLYPGHHVERDIPEAVDEVQEKFPSLNIEVSAPIGADRRLVDIVLDRIKEV